MKSTKLTRMTAAIFLTVLAAHAQLQAAPTARYTVKDLGTLGGTFTFAGGISDSGWVEGYSSLPGDNDTHAFLWRNGVMTDLGTLGGPNSFSDFRPSDFGDGSGFSDTSAPDPNGEDFCGFGTQLICRAFYWHRGAMSAQPTLGGSNSTGFGTNDLGDLAGSAENKVEEPTCAGTGQVLQYKPVLWRQGHVYQLPTLGKDPVGVAYAINDWGEAVGQTGPCGTEAFGGTGHAVLWLNGKPFDLGSLGGTTNNAPQDINNLSQVVGFSGLSGDATFHAFLWEKGVMKDLGTLAGDVHSVAESINSAGEIVGRSSDASFNGRGVVWQNGVITDLNTLIPANSDLYITEGTSNNDLGQIVGTAMKISTGEMHAFLATPLHNFSGGDMAASDHVERPNLVLSEKVRKLLQRRKRASMPW
jgi:probable HAF family extracellular repeat protein